MLDALPGLDRPLPADAALAGQDGQLRLGSDSAVLQRLFPRRVREDTLGSGLLVLVLLQFVSEANLLVCRGSTTRNIVTRLSLHQSEHRSGCVFSRGVVVRWDRRGVHLLVTHDTSLVSPIGAIHR